jgi:hypothetical protein
MKQTTSSNWLTVAGLLLALPTAWFLTICVLKFEMGVDGPYDTAEPRLNSLGLKEDLGFNINLLILAGPITGFLLAVFQVLNIHCDFEKETTWFHVGVRRRWFPILVAGFCISIMSILGLYIFFENSNALHNG